VLPFLRWLALPGIERYRYVLKLHSKKSTHLVEGSDAMLQSGDDWRRRSLGGLTGDAQRTARLLRALDAASDGLVAPPGLLFDQAAWECAVGDVIATLRDRFGIPGPLEGSFPAGTMFWARIDALALLRQPPVAALDFEPEPGRSMARCTTRTSAFSFAAAARGYRTVAAISSTR
jgi:lipopolysaccharide biosynthesis protein